MTDCGNAEIRDLLPDLVNEQLSSAEAARIQAHVDVCRDCAAEVALLRTARAIRPAPLAINVAHIVANLPRPAVVTAHGASTEENVVSLDDRRARMQRAKSGWGSRSVWRAAATIGVMIVGGWSVLIVRSGGIGVLTNGADSTRLTDAPVTAIAPTGPAPIGTAASSPSTAPASPAASRSTAVSFGSLTDYTDEEIERVLDRLDKWDGATSTETTSTTPILPAKSGEVPL